jgi:DNA-binding CsgD family transcriptional regulator
MVAETSLDSLLGSIQKSDSLDQSQIEKFNQALINTDEKFLTPTLKVFFKAKNYPNISLDKTTKILRSKVDDCEDWLHVEIFQVQDTIEKGDIHKGIKNAKRLIKERDCKTARQNYILAQSIGTGFYYIQGYDSAIHYFKKALDLSLLEKDTLAILSNKVNIGSCYYGLGAYRTALHYFQTVVDSNKDLNYINTNNVQNNIAAILNTIESYDQAAKHLIEIFPSKKDLNSHRNIDKLIAINVLRCYSNLIPDSLKKTSFNLLYQTQDNPGPYQTAIKTEIARFYYDNGEIDSARSILKKNKTKMLKDTAFFLDFALDLYSEIDGLILTNKELEDILKFATGGDYQKYASAIGYMISKNQWTGSKDSILKHYHKVTSGFFEANDSLIKKDLSVYNKIKQKDFQISSLDKKVKQSKRENQLLIIAIVSLTLIVGLILIVLFLYKKQTSYKLKLNESREASLVKQKRLAEAKSREAQTKEELISIKNNVFKELIPFFDELSLNIKEMLPGLPKSMKIKYLTFRENLDRLKTLLNLEEKANSNTITHDQSLISKEKLNLTEREIRIARLIISGMSSKEIAVTLNRKASYVNNLRSKLRKKLKLDHNQSLEEELRKLNL